MKKIIGLLAISLLFIVPGVSHASTTYCFVGRGCNVQVVYKSNNCSYSVAEDDSGQYYVYSSYGYYPQLGDTLFGQWGSSIPNQTAYDLSSNYFPAVSISVVRSQVSQDSLLFTYKEYCYNY